MNCIYISKDCPKKAKNNLKINLEKLEGLFGSEILYFTKGLFNFVIVVKDL